MQAGGLIFSGNFDSGNLGRVEVVPENVEYTGNQHHKITERGWADRFVFIYGADRRPLLRSRPSQHVKIWTNHDAHGSPFQNGNRTWFYFSVRNYKPDSVVRFSIMNLNRQAKLFNQGHAPVFKVFSPTTGETK